MPTENINIETQVQVDITRADLQALIAANTVKKKIYHISDAVAGAYKIGVFSLTNSTTSFNAFNFTQGRFGKYYIGPDVFVPIVEGQGAVLSYNTFAVFPTTGQPNTIYIDLSDDTQYYWDGSAYVELTNSNVYEPTVDDFPLIGDSETLYVATETGTMYLWDSVNEQYTPLNNTPYIPLAGTEVGSPVTGTIESAVNVLLSRLNGIMQMGSGDDLTLAGDRYSKNSFRTHPFGQAYNKMELLSASYLGTVQWFANTATNAPKLIISSTEAGFSGAQYDTDYESGFTLYSLIDLKTMKKRIWTKAGVPTTTDDSAAGYIVGSLLWDTINSIMYECTDNSAGAATWSEAIPSQAALDLKVNKSDLWRSVLTSDAAAITGVTGITKMRSVLIPANTFGAGWDVLVRSRTKRTVGTGTTWSAGIMINTIDNVAGALVLGFLDSSASMNYNQLKRDAIIKGSTTEVYNNTLPGASDDTTFVALVTSLSIDWTINQYIIFYVNAGNTAHSYTHSFGLIEGRKTIS